MDENLEGFVGFLERHGLVKFDIDGDGETHFTNRLKLQKYVLLAKTFGMPFRYQYGIYLYGPYSSGLAADYYALARKSQPNDVREADTPAGFRGDDFLKAVHNDPDWLEIAATIVERNETTKNPAVLREKVCRMKSGFDKRFIAGVFDDLKAHGLVSVGA